MTSSPNFTGVPTAPTAAVGINTDQIATCAGVLAEVGAISSGVTTFNGRAGAVTLNAADISAAGGAPINNPSFTGIPVAPTAASGTSTQQLATTAFVSQAIAGLVGVSSFNGRVGVVTLSLNDVTTVGGAPLASPTFTGTPAAPTAVAGTATTQLATTQFVATAGAALLVSPNFSGTPTAPTVAQSVNNTQLATTAYVQTAIAALPTGGVSSFNTRTGAVTLNAADISAAGGAPLASPVFTGTPQAPTAPPGTNSQQIATTAFVAAALAGGGVVSSFNTRTGAVVLTMADITAAGGAVNAYSVSTFITAGAATYTTPANSETATVYRIRMVGGGGAGGNAPAGASYGGGAGGGGEYKELIVTGRAAGEVWNITVGAGGNAPPVANAAWPGSAAYSGGATTVNIAGNAIACNGGQVGGPGGSANYAQGGVGGNGGATPALAGLTLVVDVAGGPGSQGLTPTTSGGSSMLGIGGQGNNQSPNQPLLPPATGYGSGSAGAALAGTAGTAGKVGAVIIERIAG